MDMFYGSIRFWVPAVSIRLTHTSFTPVDGEHDFLSRIPTTTLRASISRRAYAIGAYHFVVEDKKDSGRLYAAKTMCMKSLETDLI